MSAPETGQPAAKLPASFREQYQKPHGGQPASFSQNEKEGRNEARKFVSSPHDRLQQLYELKIGHRVVSLSFYQPYRR